MQQKRLLVLAAGILQVPVIKKAKDMGIYVIAADGNRNAEGLKYADKGIVVNITSEEDVLKVAREERIDGVIHPCSEVAMNVMGRLNDELGLSGITREQAIRATNKHLMREAFEKGGAPSPKSVLTKGVEDAWTQFQKLDGDGILKPSRNSGSRGIAKVIKSGRDEENTSKEEFCRLYDVARNESRDKSVLLEQFIEGPEFSIEIIVWNGRVNVLTVTDKKTTGAPHFVETGHRQPAPLAPGMFEKIEQTLYKAFAAMKIEYGAIHPEFRITKDGKIYFMEIATRMGGDCIGTDLTPLSSGYDFMGMVINICQGKAPDFTKIREPKLAENHYIMTQADLDEFERVKREEPNTIWRVSEIKPISNKPVLKSADRAGYYITIK